MNTKRFITVLILCGLVLVFLTQTWGCKKRTESGTESVQKWTCPMHPDVIQDKPGKCPKCGMDLVPVKADTNANKPGASTASSVGDVEQKMCPVLADMPIDKNIWVEYQGKKVYFCCADCKAKFQKEPEKYLANLPQLKK